MTHKLVIIRQQGDKPVEIIDGEAEKIRTRYLLAESLIDFNKPNKEHIVAVFIFNEIGDLLDSYPNRWSQ